jgi:hypothetical protein
MEGSHCYERGRNPIAMYFGRVKELELNEGFIEHLDAEARKIYANELRINYDVLYDRVMTSNISSFLKQEVEQWYSFNRDFIGFCYTSALSRELEGMLRRFNLI